MSIVNYREFHYVTVLDVYGGKKMAKLCETKMD